MAYDEGVRSIASQEGLLDGLRARAGTLLAAAALVTSFLGGQALAKPTLVTGGAVVEAEIGVPGWLAIGCFLTLALIALGILYPRGDWRFEMSANKVLGPTREGATLDDVYASLGRFHDQNRRSNRVKLDRMFWWFRLACFLLIVETVAWMIDLGDIAIPGDIPGF